MEKAGYRPRVQTAWRSVADQLDAYKRGTTRVQFGFHNMTGATGAKEALAADIWDDQYFTKRLRSGDFSRLAMVENK